jgi:peptidoglycan/LPS O-acetylase OafA/YrhL
MERWFYLDALRGILALLVVLLHYQTYFSPQPFVSFGYLAVDAFFVLSGMVIQSAYGESVLTGRISSVQFAWARFIRLYPAVALSVVLVLLLNATDISASPVSASGGWNLVKALLLIPSLNSGTAFPANVPLWSLLFECVSNIVWFLVLRLLGTRRLGTVSLGLLALLTALVLHWGGTLDVGSQGNLHKLIGGAFRSTTGFFIGAYLVSRRAAVDSFLARAKPLAWVGIASSLILARPILESLCPLARDLAPFVGICLGLFLLRRARTTPSLKAICRWLGAISYPLYLLHAPLGRLFVHWSGAPLKGLAFVVVAMVFSSLAHYWIERPLQRWLTGLTSSVGQRA